MSVSGLQVPARSVQSASLLTSATPKRHNKQQTTAEDHNAVQENEHLLQGPAAGGGLPASPPDGPAGSVGGLLVGGCFLLTGCGSGTLGQRHVWPGAVRGGHPLYICLLPRG